MNTRNCFRFLGGSAAGSSVVLVFALLLLMVCVFGATGCTSDEKGGWLPVSVSCRMETTGELTEQTIDYERAQDGRVLAVDVTANGDEGQRTSYRYNEGVFCGFETKTSDSQTIQESFSTHCEVDDRGRIATISMQEQGENAGRVIEKSFSYDEEGRLSEFQFFYGRDGMWDEKKIASFDENGIVNSVTTEYEDGPVKTNVMAQRDSRGRVSSLVLGTWNPPMQFSYDDDGNISRIVVQDGSHVLELSYTYEYYPQLADCELALSKMKFPIAPMTYLIESLVYSVDYPC